MTQAPEAPYPACIQDASYGVRWAKWRAGEWNGDAHTMGVLGSSSGGHVAQLLGMCPNNAVYNKHGLPEAPNVDTVIAYVATRSPISDPFARFQQAEKMKRDHMIKNSTTFFNPWETIFAGNPQKMLDRGEKVELPPMLIMQGGLDDNVIPVIQEKFSASYRAAGGECQYELFEGATHEWVAEPSANTTRAHEMLKAFINKQLKAGRTV
jgi:acetyl esterase/lipase